jgi:leader peptidase (prepilin peptidase)/N-methyltransferase
LSIADLIPIIGFVRAKGRCSGCGAKILLRYPLVEALGAMAAIASVATFGVSWLALFAFGYLLLLIALAAIDLETGYLPDALTLPLIASGIAVNAGGGFTPLPQSLIGAVAGYVVFWIIAFAYRRLRGRDGLGGGDATLLSGIGAWTGWLSLAPIVFIASATALLFLGFMRLLGRRFDAATPVRFGPALCAAAALFVLFLTPYWLSR